MRSEAIEHLADAQRRVLARLGPYVGDTGDYYTRGVRSMLEPTRRVIFNSMVRAEAERMCSEQDHRS